MRDVSRQVPWVVLCVLLVPATAIAQASIQGVVRDSSGAVLPGVTVDAASPVLIEKMRSVRTDGSGQFRVVDLRRGTDIVVARLVGAEGAGSGGQHGDRSVRDSADQGCGGREADCQRGTSGGADRESLGWRVGLRHRRAEVDRLLQAADEGVGGLAGSHQS